MHATDTLWHACIDFLTYSDYHPSQQSGLCSSGERSWTNTRGDKRNCRSVPAVLKLLRASQNWWVILLRYVSTEVDWLMNWIIKSNLMRLHSPTDLTGNLIMIEKLVLGVTWTVDFPIFSPDALTSATFLTRVSVTSSITNIFIIYFTRITCNFKRIVTYHASWYDTICWHRTIRKYHAVQLNAFHLSAYD